MFAQLDRELRFGYQKNGSLVVAFNDKDCEHLEVLKKRGETNGVQFLRIIGQDELRRIEPNISPDAVAALYAPEAGNVIPYVSSVCLKFVMFRTRSTEPSHSTRSTELSHIVQEYAIALAENAVDNGVELRIRREVTDIESTDDGWKVSLNHWEPADYVEATANGPSNQFLMILAATVLLGAGDLIYAGKVREWGIVTATGSVILASVLFLLGAGKGTSRATGSFANFSKLVEAAGRAVGLGGTAVEVSDMLVGGSGSSYIQKGVTVEEETVRARYIVNCAGGASDKIARMIGDDSFYIKPRIGDYILLNRNQVRTTGIGVKDESFANHDERPGTHDAIAFFSSFS